jgi:hypothetical protein
MAAPRDQLLSLLAPFTPRLLDASARGSGWNSVWRLTVDGKDIVLKVYGRRRTRLREWMTDFSHRVSGRTGYTAASRMRTESRCLRLWREAGFDVPALEAAPKGFPRLPAPFLLMEFIPGQSLLHVLTDTKAPQTARDGLFMRCMEDLSARHDVALEHREAALLQEHPALDHVLVTESRRVTFDLEVAYTTRHGVADCVTGEIAGLIRSLLKTVSPAEARHYVQLMADAYPNRGRLARVYGDLYENPSPVRRLLHALDRRRKQGPSDKYAAASLLREILSG